MEVGIYGLPFSGKSTLFDLVTGQQGSGDKAKTRVGAVVVPDERLEQLVAWYKSKKTTPVHMELHDPGIAHSEKQADDSLSNARLNPVRNLDTLVLVVRCYHSDSVPHPEDSVDPVRDLDMLLTQFIVADMEVVEKRLERLELTIKKLPKEQREQYEVEKDVLLRISAQLESENPWDMISLTEMEKKRILSFSLFHMKRFVVLGNLGDLSDEKDCKAWEDLQTAARKSGFPVVGVNAQLELELREMESEEAEEFRQSMGLEAESGSKVLRTIYEQLALVTVYTAGEKESAARPVPAGSTAPVAAGTIHSDMERGFIRAEVFSYDDLEAAGGSEPKVKQSGGLRIEGKEYVMQDGDIVIIRFSA